MSGKHRDVRAADRDVIVSGASMALVGHPQCQSFQTRASVSWLTGEVEPDWVACDISDCSFTLESC